LPLYGLCPLFLTLILTLTYKALDEPYTPPFAPVDQNHFGFHHSPSTNAQSITQPPTQQSKTNAFPAQAQTRCDLVLPGV